MTIPPLYLVCIINAFKPYHKLYSFHANSLTSYLKESLALERDVKRGIVKKFDKNKSDDRQGHATANQLHKDRRPGILATKWLD